MDWRGIEAAYHHALRRLGVGHGEGKSCAADHSDTEEIRVITHMSPIKLYPYQEDAVEKLQGREAYLLADDMGSRRKQYA